MTVFDHIGDGKNRSEPEWHPVVRKSFLFVPTAGMRVAPEVLVVELYREVFFDQRSPEVSKRDLDPEYIPASGDDSLAPLSDMERAVLYAARGRRKHNAQSRDDNFYTPAYPSLARFSWLRRKSDRVIRDFLFRALSQRIHGQGKNTDALIRSTSNALYLSLVGNNTKSNESHQQLDLTSLDLEPLEGCANKDACINRLRDLLGEADVDAGESRYSSVFRTDGQDDPLASRIFEDFIAVCELDKSLDRLQWLDLLKCFLRLSTSIWLLAHMRITLIVRDALLAELSGDRPTLSTNWPIDEISNRYLDLLRPSVTPTRQIYDHVDAYMRARVELNLLISLLDHYGHQGLGQRILTIAHGGSAKLPLDNLLIAARGVSPSIQRDLLGVSLRDALTRKCEKYKAWVAPRRKGYGQGVNYDEFLRVLRRMTKGDEDGSYLLTPTGNGFVVFPGQLMLKLVTHLSSERIKNRRLVLSDLEAHFGYYGIDFGVAAGARPRLISTMQEIGMLKGSPDAGDSVEIERPYG